MKKRIDDILDSVADPESGLSVARLGLVTKVRYAEKQNLLYIFTDFQSHRPECVTCAGISMMIMSKIITDLENAFHKAFPDCTIEFV